MALKRSQPTPFDRDELNGIHGHAQGLFQSDAKVSWASFLEELAVRGCSPALAGELCGLSEAEFRDFITLDPDLCWVWNHYSAVGKYQVLANLQKQATTTSPALAEVWLRLTADYSIGLKRPAADRTGEPADAAAAPIGEAAEDQAGDEEPERPWWE